MRYARPGTIGPYVYELLGNRHEQGRCREASESSEYDLDDPERANRSTTIHRRAAGGRVGHRKRADLVGAINQLVRAIAGHALPDLPPRLAVLLAFALDRRSGAACLGGVPPRHGLLAARQAIDHVGQELLAAGEAGIEERRRASLRQPRERRLPRIATKPNARSRGAAISSTRARDENSGT